MGGRDRDQRACDPYIPSKEAKVMNGNLSSAIYGVAIRLAAVLIFGLGTSMVLAPWAQAAGNVQASVADGSLFILGDSHDNNIILIREFTFIRVAGRGDTTVNRGRLFDAEGVTNIVVEMRGGDDFLRVEVASGPDLAFPDLRIDMGRQDDMIELLGVRLAGETQIATGDGSDIVFIDGVFSAIEEFISSDFEHKFAVDTGRDRDLVEINHAIFRSEVDVRLGSGIDAVCTHASEYQSLDNTSFDGGEPDDFPGDGFFELVIQLEGAVIDFEEFPDDCSFLGGRDF